MTLVGLWASGLADDACRARGTDTCLGQWTVSQGALNTTSGLLSSRLILIAQEERQKRRTSKDDPSK
jgi:hypothetical protein